jgi:hypothetical protein
MKPTLRCLACGSPFNPRPQNPNQRYCSTPACQLERRRRWQRQRLRTDPDYRDNQARAQATWSARHPGYWRQYRATHPAYRERNCVMQRERCRRRSSGQIAKMDASPSPRPLTSGFYVLHRALTNSVAKMNAWTVHIAVLSTPRGPLIRNCKEMT